MRPTFLAILKPNDVMTIKSRNFLITLHCCGFYDGKMGSYFCAKVPLVGSRHVQACLWWANHAQPPGIKYNEHHLLVVLKLQSILYLSVCTAKMMVAPVCEVASLCACWC